MVVERSLHRGNDVRERGHVEDVMDIPEERKYRVVIGDVDPMEMKPGLLFQLGKVLGSSRRKIVQNGYIESISEEPFDNVTSDETGTSRDEGPPIAGPACHRMRSALFAIV